VDARAKALEREHNDRAWLAWHVAALQRTRKLPKLDSLMHRRKATRRHQSGAEFWDILRAHVIASGGKVH
jgi:hypothetical protein